MARLGRRAPQSGYNLRVQAGEAALNISETSASQGLNSCIPNPTRNQGLSGLHRSARMRRSGSTTERVAETFVFQNDDMGLKARTQCNTYAVIKGRSSTKAFAYQF